MMRSFFFGQKYDEVYNLFFQDDDDDRVPRE